MIDLQREARKLIENGMYRAGVAMVGILLEHSLRHLLLKNELLVTCVSGQMMRHMSLGRMIESLANSEIITRDEVGSLREAIMLRNRAVHELAEPTKADAFRMIDHLEAFIRKYIKT